MTKSFLVIASTVAFVGLTGCSGSNSKSNGQQPPTTTTFDAKSFQAPNFVFEREISETEFYALREKFQASTKAYQPGFVAVHESSQYNLIGDESFRSKSKVRIETLASNPAEVTRRFNVLEDTVEGFGGPRMTAYTAVCTEKIGGDRAETCSPNVQATDAYKSFTANKKAANVGGCSFSSMSGGNDNPNQLYKYYAVGHVKMASGEVVQALLSKNQDNGDVECSPLPQQKAMSTRVTVVIPAMEADSNNYSTVYYLSVYQNENMHLEWSYSEIGGL